MQSGLQTLTVTTASSRSGDSGVSQSNNASAYDATTHGNNHAAFLLRQTESESTRAITSYRALDKPFFWVPSPGPRSLWTAVMCHVSCAPIFGAHQLHLCCTCTFLRCVALLFPHYPRFYYPPLDSSPPSCLTLTPLPHHPTSH